MPIRVFKVSSFARWASRAGLSDEALCGTILEIASGLIDAHLGGHLLKKRIAAVGRGKRGAYRAILAYRSERDAFFLCGFAKNERDNISAKELAALKKLAETYAKLGESQLGKALDARIILEVFCDEQDP